MKEISIDEIIWLMQDINDIAKSKIKKVRTINDSMTSEPASMAEAKNAGDINLGCQL